jgi:hypothetical protein
MQLMAIIFDWHVAVGEEHQQRRKKMIRYNGGRFDYITPIIFDPHQTVGEEHQQRRKKAYGSVSLPKTKLCISFFHPPTKQTTFVPFLNPLYMLSILSPFSLTYSADFNGAQLFRVFRRVTRNCK